MQLIMLLGFAVVVVGSVIGSMPVFLIGLAAQVIGTFGSLEEMRNG